MKFGEILVFGIISLIMISIFVSLINALSIMSSPISYGNYTKSLNFTVIYDGWNAINMTNVTCYTNSTGGVANVFALTITNDTSYTTSFTGTAELTTAETRLYNITCLLQTGNSLDGFLTNKTFYVTNVTIDGTYPLINITFPTNNTNSSNNKLKVNYTYSDTNLGFCWYSNDTMAENTTIACGTNITGITWTDGKHNVTVWANDSAGNTNSSLVIFTIDTIAPLINITFPTNNTNSSNNKLNVNYTVSDTTLDSCWYSNDSYSANTTIANCVNITNVTWTDGKHNVTVWANDSFGMTNSSLVIFTIDTTYPNNLDFGIGIEVDYANLSQSHIYINITNATEINEKNITFNIYYNNGTIANSTRYTDKRRLINVTGLAEGHYKYNVTVCDYSNNCNTTAARNILLDTTDPIVTYTCTKLTGISEGESLGCSCTAADTYDSNPTLASYTSTPVTTNAGTYSLDCTATDDAGNNKTETITYIVDVPGSYVPGTGGGGGTSYTNTYVEDTKEFSEIKEVSKELGAKNRIRIKINNIKHEVGVKALTASTATIEVSSTPQTATMNIGDARKFDVTNDGYYDLSVTLNKIQSNKASITLKSVYEKIITEAVAQEQEEQAAVAEEQTQPEATGTMLETKSNILIWVIVGIIVVLILVGIGYWIKKRR